MYIKFCTFKIKKKINNGFKIQYCGACLTIKFCLKKLLKLLKCGFNSIENKIVSLWMSSNISSGSLRAYIIEKTALTNRI